MSSKNIDVTKKPKMVAREKNPFTPSFGIVPTVLAGRDEVLQDLSVAFEEGLGNPDLSTILVGARGTGKTALLTCIADEAAQLGWINVRVLAAPGMLEDILQQSVKAASNVIEPTQKRKLTAVNVGDFLGIEWTLTPEDPSNWRTKMETLLDKLDEADVGLLIEVDEANASIDELVQLVGTYQLFIGDGRKVALVMAGLPSNITNLVEDSRITFLRRAKIRNVGRIEDADVEAAFLDTLHTTSKQIDRNALELVVRETNGFAFMMQLIGYCAWRHAKGQIIDIECAKSAVEQAKNEFRRGVLDATLSDMSAGDFEFAKAMARCKLPASLSEVAREMNRGTNYASTYKTRLLRAGVVGQRGKTKFDFEIPMIKEYLLEL